MALMLACVGKAETSGEGHGGRVETGGAAPNVGGANPTMGGSSASTGGANTGGGGGSADAAGQSGTGGQNGTAGGSGTAGQNGTGGQKLVDCDLRKVECRAAQPGCPENQVPSVNGVCFGPCVPIESCACAAAQDCPFNDRYTCWQRTHCGPYVR